MSFLNSLKIWLEFFRIKIGIFGMCLTLLGFSLSQTPYALLPNLLLSSFFLTLFAYVLNNFFDIEEDKFLGKHYVLFIKKWMLIFPIFFFILAILFSPNFFTLTIVIFSALLAAAYSIFRLKRYPFKSFYTGGLISVLYLIGKQSLDFSLVPLAFFLIAIGHVSDMRDFEGDKKAGLKTLPVMFGGKIVWIMQRTAVICCAFTHSILSFFALPSFFKKDPNHVHSIMLNAVIFSAFVYFFIRIVT